MKQLVVAVGLLFSISTYAAETVQNSFCSDSKVHNFTIQTESDGYFVIYNHSSQTFVKYDAGVDLSKGVVLNIKQDSTRPFIGWKEVQAGEVVVVKQGFQSVVVEGASIYILECGA